nr:MAG TPA: hypothetical protein [Caudoviricetes sp.]
MPLTKLVRPSAPPFSLTSSCRRLKSFPPPKDGLPKSALPPARWPKP